MSQQGKIKVGIDARFYGPEQKGLGRYVQQLVDNLEQIIDQRAEIEFVIFLRSDNWAQYQSQNSKFSKILANCHWYGFKEQILMPWKIIRAKIDLMHFPHFNVPIFCPKPFVITIHDLILKRFSTRRASTLGSVKYWFKNLAYHWVINLAVKRARKIIAVSNFTKQDIIQYFKVHPGRIKVIYEGAPIVDYGSLAKTRPLNKLKSFGIIKPYLLYVGNAYPHKNLENLIKAFIKFNHDGQYQLVLAGKIDYFYQRLKSLIPDFMADKIIFTDFISDQDLQLLYQNALLYAFPSFYEGFGLPPLEAMSYGLPVVSSNASCLPEILGEAAEYFNPEDMNEIAKAISSLLKDKNRQQELIIKGRQKASQYSWLKMSEMTLMIYQNQF